MIPDESLAQADLEELPWLAFLYVAEELTPDELVDFEERLLTEQDAREAVAKAAKIAEGLWVAAAMESLTSNSPPAVVEHSRRSRRANWMGGTVLAGLAFCVGWWFANPSATPPRPTDQVALAPTREANKTVLSHELEGAGQLLELWTETQLFVAELDFGLSLESPPELSEDLAMRDVPEDDQFSWMIVALSADSPTQPTNPAVMEN